MKKISLIKLFLVFLTLYFLTILGSGMLSGFQHLLLNLLSYFFFTLAVLCILGVVFLLLSRLLKIL